MVFLIRTVQALNVSPTHLPTPSLRLPTRQERTQLVLEYPEVSTLSQHALPQLQIVFCLFCFCKSYLHHTRIKSSAILYPSISCFPSPLPPVLLIPFPLSLSLPAALPLSPSYLPSSSYHIETASVTVSEYVERAIQIQEEEIRQSHRIIHLPPSSSFSSSSLSKQHQSHYSANENSGRFVQRSRMINILP